MSDIFDTKTRSAIMRRIKSNGTLPELHIRRLLCDMGFGHYRLKSPTLLCSPDIIFPCKKKAIFVNGCFWHGHDCSRGHLPKNNYEFWKNKIRHNKERDIRNYEEIKSIGWEYLVIWQCEIKEKNRHILEDRIRIFLSK